MANLGKPSLQRIEELFHRAVDLEAQEQARFLDAECAGDEVLRAAVEKLLQHDERPGKTESMIAGPIARTLLDESQAAAAGGFGEALALLRHAIEGYELIEVLGSGGMGVVFKARQLSLDRLVAVKMLLSAAPVTADQFLRFRTEAEALARLRHPNIVQIFEVGEHEGRPYIVMEYVSGPNLSHALDGKPQPTRGAAELVATLAGAIQAVHECGIIHRDLKPGNVLLQIADSGLQIENQQEVHAQSAVCNLQSAIPKLSDFGIAKRLDRESSRTKSGAILGTPSYMAPEQAGGQGKVVGPAADIYALGAILYEMLTGRPPFDGASAAETVAQVVSDEPISPARLRPTLPRDLVTICLKCLEKEPRRRYLRADELAQDLRTFLAGEPIRARRIGPPERLWRWCRRRPLVAALSATSAILALALAVTIIVYQSLLHAAMSRQLENTKLELADTAQQARQKGQLAEEERHQLAALDRTLGARDIEEGDDFAALIRLAEALRLDSDDPEQERKDRVWISLLLQHCPRLARLQTYDSHIAGAQLGSSGCWLATVGADRTLRIWDMLTGKIRTLAAAVQPGAESLPVAISPDGRFVSVSAPDGSTRVWDVDKGQPHGAPIHHAAAILRASFSDNNQALIAHLADGTIQVWDIATGRHILPETAASASTRLAGASDNGRWLFLLSADGVGQLYQLPEGKAVGTPLAINHALGVVGVRSDGRQVAILDAHKALWVWDIDAGTSRLLVRSLDNEGPVRQIHWSPDGRSTLVVGDHIRIWDADAGTPATPCLALGGRVLLAGFTGNDTVLALDDDGHARFWELQPIRLETGPKSPPAPTVQAAAAKGPIRLTNGKIVDVKAPTLESALWPLPTHEKLVDHAAFSADGRRLAACNDGHDVVIWDSALGTQVTSALRHRENVVYAAFSPDGNRLVTASGGGTLAIWDLATSEPTVFPLRTWHDLERVAFGPAGMQIVAMGKAGFMRTWSLTPEARPCARLEELAQVMSGRRMTGDGALLPLEAERLEFAWKGLHAADIPMR
jgi:serine/threonine protein kinase/WD40 repeat protein